MKPISEIKKTHKKRDFIVDNLLKSQGMYCLVARPKVGKSLLALQLAHSIATNTQFLGNETSPSPVLYISTEMDESQIYDRILSMNLTFPEDNLIIEDDFSKINIMDIKLIISDFAVNYSGNFVIIDMLANNNLTNGLNLNDYQEINSKLMPTFRDLSKKYDITFLLIHHLNKNNTTLGSTAIDGSVDGIITITEDNRYKNKYLLSYNSRDYPSFEIRLKRNKFLQMEVIKEEQKEFPIEILHFIKYAISKKEFNFKCSDMIENLNILITPTQFGRILNENIEALKLEGFNISKTRTSTERNYHCSYAEVLEDN